MPTKPHIKFANTNKEKVLEEMIRVNHAGEFGAKRIYKGQLAIIKNAKTRKIIEHMNQQEQEHLAYFTDQIKNRKIRPTALMPLWHISGFALGAITALMGEKAAFACTVAVEEAIDEHYKQQLDYLKTEKTETELYQKIEKFRQDELEHRDTGINNKAKEITAYPLLYNGIKNITKTAIWLSKKI